MDLWVEFVKLNGYADDTSAHEADEDIEALIPKLEHDARNILEFMASNQLVANTQKTDLIIFKPNRKNEEPRSVFVVDAHVQESKQIKLLGLTISCDLRWTAHLKLLESATAQRIGLIRRMRTTLSQENLRTVAFGLVISKIRYGLAVFGRLQFRSEDATPTELKHLQIMLNGLMRIMTGNKLKDKKSIGKLMEETGLPAINQLIAESTLNEMWRLSLIHI